MASKRPQEEPAAEPSFEEALANLEQIVRDLEEGQLGLNEALKRYEEGVKLLRRCYDLLEGAERRIALVSGLDAEGNPILQSFDDQSTLSLEEKGKGRSRRRSAPETPSTGEGDQSSLPETDVDVSGGAL